MTDNYAARDLATIAHPYANLATLPDQGPVVMERGDGVYVYDSAGKPYLEGMSGLWCASLGFSNAELVEAAREQMARLPFNHLFAGRSHDPAIALAEKLKDMAPIPVSRVFFCNSGSEANDTQIKLVWYMNNALGRPTRKRSSAASAPITASPSPALRSLACLATTPILTCPSPASCTPPARTITATPMRARARKISPPAWPMSWRR